MSADRYKYELFKEKFSKADIDALLEQKFKASSLPELYMKIQQFCESL